MEVARGYLEQQFANAWNGITPIFVNISDRNICLVPLVLFILLHKNRGFQRRLIEKSVAPYHAVPFGFCFTLRYRLREQKNLHERT